jgi:hypothetical protein
MLSLSVCDSPHNTCGTDTNLKANHHSSSCFALIRITWLILHASRCFIGILANVRTVAISSPQLHENSLPSSCQSARFQQIFCLSSNPGRYFKSQHLLKKRSVLGSSCSGSMFTCADVIFYAKSCWSENLDSEFITIK